MSTANFHTQKNFGLFIQNFEPISMEEYQKEYFMDDVSNYPLYQSVEDETLKNTILENSYNQTMDFWNELFYEDIFEGLDGFLGIMEDFNTNLTFHELKFKSGYYAGVQIFVEETENPHELDNEDCKYYYDMCRSKAIRKYDAEIRKINKFLEKTAAQYGWKELHCLGVFSNGEAIYEYA